jgi:ribonuclease P protein component
VTTRQLGSAVVRNRVRRLLRETMRHLHPQLRPGFDLVIVTRPIILKQPFDEIGRIVSELCNQAGLVEDDV